MAELISANISNRAIFPKGEQTKVLNRARESLSVSWPQFAHKFSVHQRTMSDWKREQYSIPIEVLQRISKEVDIAVPAKVEVKDRYWYTGIGAVAGADAVLKKYGRMGGDPQYRKKKWYEWWEREGRYQKHPLIGVTKPIKKPRLSKKLAEFVGIMMGDGGITKHQLRITLNGVDDKEYAQFVKGLIEEIFEVPVSLIKRTDQIVVDLLISRRELVIFCNEKLGLKVGNKLKQGLDMPDWVKKNIEFQKACLRGLVDTDGCIFNEVHSIRGKRYSYKRLNFTSASPQLRASVYVVFSRLGMTPRLRRITSVQLEDKMEIKRYFKIIGTSNPKHLRRFLERV